MRSLLDHQSRDLALAHRAANQHGVVTTDELLAHGLGYAAIHRRLARGRLFRVYPGVYAVGHPGLSADGIRLAAVLACGPRAALSHVSAALVWGLVTRADREVHVTVPSGAGRVGPPGIRVHRTRVWTPEIDTVLRGRLRLTSPARTIVDSAATMTPREIERLLDSAHARGAISWTHLARAMAVPRPGVGRLRRVLGLHRPGSTATRSHSEEHLLALIRAAGVLTPRVNACVGPWEVDFFWPVQKVAVEVDGGAFHSSPWAIARDGAKDTWLRQRGIAVHRVPSAELRERPQAVIEAIAALVSGAGCR